MNPKGTSSENIFRLLEVALPSSMSPKSFFCFVSLQTSHNLPTSTDYISMNKTRECKLFLFYVTFCFVSDNFRSYVPRVHNVGNTNVTSKRTLSLELLGIPTDANRALANNQNGEIEISRDGLNYQGKYSGQRP